MASHQHLLQYSNPRSESPAKVFAKLKSKVQREGAYAKDGVSTRNEPLGDFKINHGAEFRSPRTPTEKCNLNERKGFSSRDEAKALTISPISSPQKNFGFWNSRDTLVEDLLVSGREHGCTPRKGGFLDSSAVPHPHVLVNSKQNHVESTRSRDVDGFYASNKTHMKAVENDQMLRKDQTFEKSPTSVYSPMRNRLRKRKFEPWDFGNISSSTKIHNDTQNEPQENRNGCVVMENLVHRPGFSAVQPVINHFPREPIMPPPRSMSTKHCRVLLEMCPPLSPAKMFALMKKRENRAAHQDVRHVNNSMRALFTANEFPQSIDTPQPTVSETVDTATMSDGESTGPGCQSIADTAESQSAMDPSEDVRVPAVSSQPVLIEDPLILNSPRVSIPKKSEPTLQPDCPQLSKISPERVIHLRKWFLRHNQKGLFVEGIHREENIAWNSNIIAERVSHYAVKTITGRVYILVGKMNLHMDSDFPRWFLKKFLTGFPVIWKEVYEKFLSESRFKDTRRKNESRGNTAKTKSKDSVNPSVKSQRKNVFKTPDTGPSSSSSATMLSRSGRVIKPPLEFWKGGRVILDAHMNVTIHDCYNTSICNPEDTAAVSVSKLKKFLIPSQNVDKAALAPKRNTKAPSRRRNKVKGNRGEEPSHSPDPSVESLSIPERSTGRQTRSSQRAQHVNAAPDRSNEISSPVKARKQKSATKNRRRHTVPASPLSPHISETAPEHSAHDSLMVRRTKPSKRVQKKRGEDSPQLQHAEQRRKEVRKRRGQQNQEKNKKISEPTNSKSSTSSKKPKMYKGNMQIPPEQDEDKWTEEELAKLQEAVALYPKHTANYWAKVASIVGTRRAEECLNQLTCQGTSPSPVRKARKGKKKQPEAPKGPDNPVISGGVGTFKRKQQVRHFLGTMSKDNVDDVFSSSYMQNKHLEMPTTYTSNLSDEHDIRDLEPVTPMSAGFPAAKTPQALYITPGMMGSSNRSTDDKYVFQFQKREKNPFNVKQAPSKKSFTATPSAKRTMKRCGNAGKDTFVVWEMFPGNERVLSDSEAEEDYYFSDNDCT
ncbi:mis18-binding protein 1 [Takifugu flavidus]|uniref:mis18-binding protein 1 n=1 Tax=Takifugu flavidus TaxID=433684 RepID=UPI002544B1E9|nr:mis18-binding protein 1 [Takifugu flavidus]